VAKLLLTIDYFLLALPGILVAAWAQVRISKANAAGARVPAASGLTGAEVALRVMEVARVTSVQIEPAVGELADHYDARHKLLRLSRCATTGRCLLALGVAAHEAGHAIQDAARYPALLFRNLIVPLACIGSEVCWLLFLAGFLFGMMRLILLAIVLFSLLVFFQLVNLPVEFDASRRGRRILLSTGMISGAEEPVVARVQNAAAWTYVAASLTGAFRLLTGSSGKR
jgi:Zn-dependent membrane protease YugP